MTLEPQALPKERIASYLYFSSLYFVSVGTLYLWGYWSTFNINILEYLGFIDILKSTAYPISTSVITISVGAFIGVIGTIFPSDSESKIDELFHKLFIKIKPTFTYFYILVLPLLILFGPVEKWQFLPIFLSIPFTVIFVQHPLLIRLVPHFALRFVLVFVLIMLIPQAYATGRLDANEIVTGKDFSYVISDIDGANLDKDVLPSRRLRFLGHAGEFVFFINPTQASIFISKLDSGKSLILRRVTKGVLEVPIKSVDVPKPNLASSSPN